MSIPVLRDYQVSANDRVEQAARQGAHVIIQQAPTGSGKTSCACDLVRRAVAKGTDVLLLVHRRRLVDQISDRLNEFEVDHGVLMRGHRHERACKVQVGSRDTILSRCIQQQYFGLPPARLVIVDEGRHATSDEMRGLLKHYEDQGAYVILLDATPVLPDGRGLGPWAQAMVVAAKVTDLVQQGWLVPVQCFAPDRLYGRGGKYKRGIAGNLVENWQRYAEGQPTVLFCSRVQHSQDAVADLQAAGIPAAHVDSDTSDDDRDRIFDDLEKGVIKVVSNVGIIKEGVDLPCLGCVQFFMDPASRTGFLQACGRIMRPYPGKSHGIVIDHAGAIFRYGFPDEDTPWSLQGNVDAKFAAQVKDGITKKALYCKTCELLYHGQLQCPQCGRQPQKPPRSFFAAPPIETRDELLTEAERGVQNVYGKEEKQKHWLRCLGVAARRNGTFGMASMIYKQKYSEWPREDFPCQGRPKQRVLDLYPGFGKKKAQ